MVQAKDRVSELFERVSEVHYPEVRWRALIAVPLNQRFPVNDLETYNSGSSERVSSEYNILFAFNWLLRPDSGPS